MKKLLEITAIKMIPPKPYGMFHITFFVLSIVLSCILANKLKDVSDRKNKKILFFTGLFLLVIEVYKELFYYFVVNNGSYDFSIFPFQLCDVPMYICLIIPFIKNKKIEEGMYNFMASYNLLGAFITFFEPSSLLRPYFMMTLHGFLWHAILVFLGIYIALSGRCLKNKKDFITSNNKLSEQLRSLKQEKAKLLDTDSDDLADRTRDLMDVLEDGPDFLDRFDAELFDALVEKIIVDSNERLRFRLKNGLELTEQIERTRR